MKTVTSLEERERKIQVNLDEKISKISRLEEEVRHCVGKLDTLETVHRKEMEAQKQRVCFVFVVVVVVFVVVVVVVISVKHLVCKKRTLCEM